MMQVHSSSLPLEKTAKSRTDIQKEETEMSTQLADEQSVERFVPSKEEFLKQIASGKSSISKIERAWNMNPGSLHYWIGKWGYKGIKPDRARQLLDEMAVAPEAPKEIRGLAAINEQFNQKESLTSLTEREEPTHKAEEIGSTPDTNDMKYRLDRALERISTMTDTVNAMLKSNDTLKRERDDYKQAALDLEAKIDTQADHVTEIERLRNELGTAFGQRNELDQAITEAKKTIEELESDRQVLLATIEQASNATETAPKRAGRSLHTELDAPTEQIVDELAALISYIRSGNGAQFYLDLQLVEVTAQ
jgi:myosin heavy subunit